MYRNSEDLLDTIDATPYGPITPATPAWKRQTYVIYTRNPLRIAEQIAASSDFSQTWDYRPHEEYTGPECRRFANLMSGCWANKQADKLAEDPQMHGAMFVPVVLGADKMTVSVMTGHQQYHPLYMSLGNMHNEMRHAHRDAVVPLAFLAIPKFGCEASTDKYRVFIKHIYHAALAQILSPLEPGMTTPHIMRCPDGHFRRAVFELGPFIADYPEQVCLAGIVYGWCPKCQAYPDELEDAGPLHFREHTEALVDTLTPRELWDIFGIVADPFTSYFPRADIHELLTPDLLHQLIKGTFKDHLVDWVVKYIKLTAANDKAATRIIEEIDRRVAAAPSFPGLRRFPHRRNFSQWTGNDSKGLMKVYLASIAGLVPQKMPQCLGVFLDFAYAACRAEHDTLSLEAMQEALAYFHDLRTVFVKTGVWPNGFGLPRQHFLVHYILSIQKFGSPNGLRSLIMESKHIEAVKETWRCSNRNEPTGQMIGMLTCLSKLSAAAVEFGHRGMLQNDVLTAVQLALADDGVAEDPQSIREQSFLDALEDAQDVDGPRAEGYMYLGERQAVFHLPQLTEELQQPRLYEYICRFLFRELYPGQPMPQNIGDDVFYAPTELSGPGGMHREIIRATPLRFQKFSRYDTVLVVVNPEVQGMMRYRVARVRQFMSFTYGDVMFPSALVEWFVTDANGPDAATGMWIRGMIDDLAAVNEAQIERVEMTEFENIEKVEELYRQAFSDSGDEASG
ncbi:hypothetical protein LXA43DRAFT_1097529 [Ganoderma leucocontextum]|nr:hypothetical protein LXA43DRAFT_1097529 [Ganoderma leucocontextum]